jgi:transcription initiation factor TFIIB
MNIMAEGRDQPKPSGSQWTNVVQCPHHPGASLIEDHSAGDMICQECGLVVGDRVIDVGSEWRTFSNDKSSADRSRVGAAENPLLDGGELTTYIGSVATKPGSADNSTSFTQWQKKGMSATDRGLVNAFRDIGTMADKLNLPRIIIDRCNALFKQVHEEKQLKGRANDAVAAACLYIACRQEGVPRSFKEICAVSRHPKKEIGKCFKLITRQSNPIFDTSTPVTTDFMSRYCTNLQLPTAVQKAASHIAKKAVDMDLAPG